MEEPALGGYSLPDIPEKNAVGTPGRGRGRRHVRIDRVLAALLLLALIKCLLWTVASPPWRGPDELSHFSYIEFLSREHTVPLSGRAFYYPDTYESRNITGYKAIWGYQITIEDPDTIAVNTAATHPPLYYALMLPAYWAADNGSVATQVYAVRIWESLIFLALIYVSYRFARLIFPRGRHLQIGVPLLLIFHPQLGFISSIVSNEGLLTLLFTVFLWQLVFFALRDASRRRAAVIGLVMGLGMLTKSSFAPAYVVAAAVIGGLFIIRKGERWRMAQAGGIMLGLSLLVCGWFYLRTYVELGFLFPPGSVFKYGANSLWQLWTETRFPADLIKTFLGDFSWVTIPLPDTLLSWFRGITEVAAVGAAAVLAGNIVRRRDRVIAPWLVLFFTGVIVLFFLSVSWFELKVGDAQGRYLFSAIFPFWSLFLVGLTGWMPRSWQPRATAVVVAVAGLFSAWTLIGLFISNVT